MARAMYKTIEIDQEISPDLYLAMAEVLAYVYRLRGLRTAQPQSVGG
ncbi:MAG: EscU/YscU/HrcU family type III secretion system export apparatus switch protein [Bellilinea sp.]